jgi:hypothetical protein
MTCSGRDRTGQTRVLSVPSARDIDSRRVLGVTEALYLDRRFRYEEFLSLDPIVVTYEPNDLLASDDANSELRKRMPIGGNSTARLRSVRQTIMAISRPPCAPRRSAEAWPLWGCLSTFASVADLAKSDDWKYDILFSHEAHFLTGASYGYVSASLTIYWYRQSIPSTANGSNSFPEPAASQTPMQTAAGII